MTTVIAAAQHATMTVVVQHATMTVAVAAAAVASLLAEGNSREGSSMCLSWLRQREIHCENASPLSRQRLRGLWCFMLIDQW